MNDVSGGRESRVAPLARVLGDFTSALRYEQIPEPVRRRARYLILDAVGIAHASATMDFARRTLASLQELGEGSHPVIGMKARLALRDAALMNGVLIHGLDYDDTHVPGIIHGTASLFPTALGMAAQAGRSGAELLTAYIAGMETASRLGAAAKGGFHQVGFHPTGLVGAFGCALTSGKLLGLTPDEMVMAQGITLSFASGSLEFLEDGAWTKRVQPGWAAVSGITAASLARHGFIGPGSPYEGRFGLFASYLGELASACDFDLATRGLGSTWEIEQVAIKPFPACHFTHACADAAIAIARDHELDPGAVRTIRALVPQEVVKVVCEPVAEKVRSTNEYQAQFSIPYVVAAALLRGRFGLAELAAESLNDPAIVELAGKVRYEVDPQSGFPKYYSGEVIVITGDGKELRHREHVNRGSVDRPISEEEIEAKFMDNMQLAVSRARADEVRNQILELDALAASSDLSGALAMPIVEGNCA